MNLVYMVIGNELLYMGGAIITRGVAVSGPLHTGGT
jgi:hypothetical protein